MTRAGAPAANSWTNTISTPWSRCARWSLAPSASEPSKPGRALGHLCARLPGLNLRGQTLNSGRAPGFSAPIRPSSSGDKLIRLDLKGVPPLTLAVADPDELLSTASADGMKRVSVANRTGTAGLGELPVTRRFGQPANPFQPLQSSAGAARERYPPGWRW